jgi:hypothetical protein
MHAEYRIPKLGIAEESFNSLNITVLLNLIPPVPGVQPYNVSVTAFPPVTLVYNHTHAELILSFNTRYNINFTSTFCGLSSESDTLQSFYGECFSLNQLLLVYICFNT